MYFLFLAFFVCVYLAVANILKTQRHSLLFLFSDQFCSFCCFWGLPFLKQKKNTQVHKIKMHLCITYTLITPVHWRVKMKDLPPRQYWCCLAVRMFFTATQSVLFIYLSNMFADLSENTMAHEQWPWGANYHQLESEVAPFTLLHVTQAHRATLELRSNASPTVPCPILRLVLRKIAYCCLLFQITELPAFQSDAYLSSFPQWYDIPALFPFFAWSKTLTTIS